MRKITTIQVSLKTKKMLDEVGKKGETYDQILQKLLKFYMKK